MVAAWVLMLHTTCGPLWFLNDAPSCWMALDESGYAYATQEECEAIVGRPPAAGEFRCEYRPLTE